MPSTTSAPEFELPNVGPGPHPFTLNSVAAEDHDAIVLLFQRDYHCRNCRRQVREVADRYEAFRALDALVVSILPESRDRAADWQAIVGAPYPVLADPGAAAGDAYDQPTRFSILGSLHDIVGRMPLAVVLDVRDGALRLAASFPGDRPADRPSVDTLLAECQAIHEDTAN